MNGQRTTDQHGDAEQQGAIPAGKTGVEQALASPSKPFALETATMHPANSRQDILAVEEAVLGALIRAGYDEASRFAVRLALEEGIVNAFLHGHRGLPNETTLTVHYAVTPDETTLSITDQGPGFNPASVPDPTLDENLELPSGRGLMLMRAYMNGGVHHENGGSTLVMKYLRNAPSVE